MELDPFLHRIQSVLRNEQRLLGNLDTIKSDNEDVITKVLTSLNKITDGTEELEKSKKRLYVLVFLNTNTDLYNNLKKNRKYAHLVGFLPKLSPVLFMKIVISLQLHQYLYESVVRFCSPLSYHVLDLCLNCLKWLDLFDAVSFVENLITSLFHKIVLTDEKDNFNTALKDMFQRLLLHYDAEKSGCIKRMNLWKSAKLKHYAGLIIASLLSLLEKCTRIYSKTTDEFKDIDSIFNIEVNEELIKFDSKMITEGRPFSVQQCYEHVVSKCYENVCSITVNIWLFWVEIDLDDIPDTENTLQRLIGEKAFICRETLKEAECAGVSSSESADLLLKLKNLALKPHAEEDDANLLSLSQILSNIQDPSKDTNKWLKFLINKPFVTEPSALEVIKNYLNVIGNVELEKLWKVIIAFIKANNECRLHKEFLLDMVKTLDAYSQTKLSKCFVDNFGLSDILKTEEFQSELIETFNKVINEDDKEKELYRQFLRLALQSPDTVITRIVADGIISEVRGHLMADILGRLQSFCDAPYSEESSLLIAALAKLLDYLPDSPEGQRANFPLFVRELVMRKSLDGEQFIKICLMLKIHKNLKSKNWIVMNACLETLSELYDVNCVHNCPASLVMVLQVVQAVRWEPSTFSMAAVRVCELALQLVDLFVTKWIEIGFEDKYLRNLSELVQQRISPLNRYHLYRLLSEEKFPTDPGLQLIYRMHYGIGDWSVLQVSSDNRIKLVYALCYVLPVLTSQEWQELFCVAAPKCSEFLCLFHIVTDALLLSVDSAKVRASRDVLSCLGFAVLNVAQVIKYEVNRWTKDDNEYRISVLSKMCQLVAAFPVTQQEDFGMTLVKVLQQLLPEGSRRHPLSAEDMNVVTASLAGLRAAEVRQKLAKEFLDMVHR